MRTSRAAVLTAVLLGAQQVCVFEDGTVFPPNPIGEKLYRADILHGLAPLLILLCALAAAWIIHSIRHKAEKPDPPK